MQADGAYGPDPLAWFAASFARAQVTESFDASRAALATVDGGGQPAVRFVLVKGVSERGFEFYTNLQSHKARQLGESPRAALAFHWESISEQVRVEGAVVPVEDAEADAYFASRPRGSRLAAWASSQSQPIADRATLDARYAEVEQQFKERDVPRPDFWGGYRIEPARIEFWCSREERLHDRWLFSRVADGWDRVRLQP